MLYMYKYIQYHVKACVRNEFIQNGIFFETALTKTPISDSIKNNIDSTLVFAYYANGTSRIAQFLFGRCTTHWARILR